MKKMKVCFPVAVNNGLNSELFNHFASSPLFLIVDTESGDVEALENCDPQAPEKGCNPFAALQGQKLDAIVVDAIGDAVHQTMNMCGFRVYTANSTNLQQLVEALKNEHLEEIEPFYSQDAGRCGDDDAEDSCDHDHDEEDEAPDENCVLNGGSGCVDHVDGSCTLH
jgi:predicted Fe-Mo cluster-binding NifX family protein